MSSLASNSYRSFQHSGMRDLNCLRKASGRLDGMAACWHGELLGSQWSPRVLASHFHMRQSSDRRLHYPTSSTGGSGGKYTEVHMLVLDCVPAKRVQFHSTNAKHKQKGLLSDGLLINLDNIVNIKFISALNNYWCFGVCKGPPSL